MKDMHLNLIALICGAFLALMISFNSGLGLATTPQFSSLMAHLIGFVGSYLFWIILQRKGFFPYSKEAPKYSYGAGLIGASIVIMSNITVQSPIGLAGTVALSILGQITFSLVSDIFGLFGLEKRVLNRFDVAQMTLVIFGTMIILFG